MGRRNQSANIFTTHHNTALNIFRVSRKLTVTNWHHVSWLWRVIAIRPNWDNPPTCSPSPLRTDKRSRKKPTITICPHVPNWHVGTSCHDPSRIRCIGQPYEYLCWFGYLNWLGKHNSVHLIAFQTHWKENSICTPFFFKFTSLRLPLPLEFKWPSVGGMDIFWNHTVHTNWIE